jgi:hypothetical protein
MEILPMGGVLIVGIVITSFYSPTQEYFPPLPLIHLPDCQSAVIALNNV